MIMDARLLVQIKAASSFYQFIMVRLRKAPLRIQVLPQRGDQLQGMITGMVRRPCLL